MANIVRIKRRAAGGAAGAPSSLQNAELAFNEQDDVLYYGKGTGGAGGTATTVIPIGGSGAFPLLSGSYANPSWITSLASTKITGPIPGTQISGDIAGNAGTATALQTTRSISLSGDGTWTVNFNGTANATGTFTLANSGVTAGTFTKVTVDAKGRVTFGGTLLASDIPTLTASKISDFDTQVRTSRLDQLAAPTSAVQLNSQRLTGLADPLNPQDAATKNYVDMTVQGLDPKQSVTVATTANIALLSGPIMVDGVMVQEGERVLVKDQTNAAQNGIYVVTSGSWTRALDANAWSKLPGAYVFVERGNVNAEMGFVCTSDEGGTLGTDPITFQQFSGAGQVLAGAGLVKTGNELSVVSANAGRIVVNADSIDLATVGTAGTYRSVTTDAYGRVTAGTNPTTLAGYGITDAQALDATLTALAGVTTAANKLIYATGADTFTTTDLTVFGRSLIDDVDAATARTTLGLGTMSTQAASGVAITGGSITNLTTFDGITIDGGTF